MCRVGVSIMIGLSLWVVPAARATDNPVPCVGSAYAAWVSAGHRFHVRASILAAMASRASHNGCRWPSDGIHVGWLAVRREVWRHGALDGDGDGYSDPYDAVDAAWTTARFLAAHHVGHDPHGALRAWGATPGQAQAILFAAGHGALAASRFPAQRWDPRQRLQARLEQDQQELASISNALPSLRAQVRSERARMGTLAKRQARADREASVRMRSLEQATSAYVQMTQSLGLQTVTVSSADQQALTYLAQARNAREAALVYSAAAGLWNRQAQLLARLRVAAQHSQAAQLTARRIQAAAAAMLQERRQQLQRQADLLRARRVDLRRVHRAMAHLGPVVHRRRDAFRQDLQTLSPSIRMLVLARLELALHVSEQPPGSNDSPDIARYRTATVGAQPGQPWCAYFVSYIAKEAGVPLGDLGQGIGYVPDLRAWAQRTGRWLSGQNVVPRPGDLFVLPQHVGIVERVRGEQLITIEGNHAQRLDEVLRETQEALGFIRLDDPDGALSGGTSIAQSPLGGAER